MVGLGAERGAARRAGRGCSPCLAASQPSAPAGHSLVSLASLAAPLSYRQRHAAPLVAPGACPPARPQALPLRPVRLPSLPPSLPLPKHPRP